ncbi:hypothetical protein FRB90_009055 [Tulasnella sp. 427]|nr:hypothetical protein FRB90_009055 [Tulasnella sp. 427]
MSDTSMKREEKEIKTLKRQLSEELEEIKNAESLLCTERAELAAEMVKAAEEAKQIELYHKEMTSRPTIDGNDGEVAAGPSSNPNDHNEHHRNVDIKSRSRHDSPALHRAVSLVPEDPTRSHRIRGESETILGDEEAVEAELRYENLQDLQPGHILSMVMDDQLTMQSLSAVESLTIVTLIMSVDKCKIDYKIRETVGHDIAREKVTHLSLEAELPAWLDFCYRFLIGKVELKRRGKDGRCTFTSSYKGDEEIYPCAQRVAEVLIAAGTILDGDKSGSSELGKTLDYHDNVEEEGEDWD